MTDCCGKWKLGPVRVWKHRAAIWVVGMIMIEPSWLDRLRSTYVGYESWLHLDKETDTPYNGFASFTEAS